MNEDKVQKDIEVIQQMRNAGAFNRYIEYIDFPFYKNLLPRTRINFSFPMTVLIGKNGGGKSSTLHALFGAPLGYTCSDFWFSTEVDPILESGDRPRYFYGYRNDKNSDIKEVMKMRIKRGGTETKKEDPDYWETSRPAKKDGMLKTERCSPVEKEVIYLDFRAEVSAFDKILHFSKEGLADRKELLRGRSVYLKRLFADEPMRFRGQPDSKMGKMEQLAPELVSKISNILNKKYTEIKVAEHKLYKNYGTSVYLKTEYQGGYSEANAGSGEIAVVQLVRRIEAAKDCALILLDEPEVSLHPGAQENMKEYLLDAIKRKRLQVIISSHSPSLIHMLPDSAIKLFKTDEKGKFYIKEDVNYQEAFFDIEDKITDKKIIYCEDYAAKMLIDKTLKSIGKEQFFDVFYYHGGEKTLINHYMTSIALNSVLSEKVFMLLDGDMDTGYEFKEETLRKAELESADYLLSCIKTAYGMELDAHPDGGSGGERIDQKIEEYLEYLRYYSTNVRFLPARKIPEEIILDSKYVSKRYGDIIKKYDVINSGNAKSVVMAISEDDHGDREHYEDTISMLTNKWCMEEGELKHQLCEILMHIFRK